MLAHVLDTALAPAADAGARSSGCVEFRGARLRVPAPELPRLGTPTFAHPPVTTPGHVRCVAWGLGSSGQLGLGDYGDRLRPTPLPPSSFADAARHERGAAPGAEGGSVLPGAPGAPPPLRQLACGERHSAALLEDGR